MSISLSFSVGTSGRTLFVETVGSPAPGLTAIAEASITVTVDGTDHVVTAGSTTGPLWTDPNIVVANVFGWWGLPFLVAPGATVTVSAASGLVTAGGSGSSGTLTAHSVTNNSGVDWLPDPLTGDRSMRDGYQPSQGVYYSATNSSPNLLNGQAQPGWGDANGDTTYVTSGGTDAIGLPLHPTTGMTQGFLLQVHQDTGNVLGYYNIARQGLYHILWTGTAELSLISWASSTHIAEQAGSAHGHRIFLCTCDTDSDFVLIAYLDKIGKTCTDLRVYGPGTDYADPPVFDPDFLAQHRGNRVVRLKDLCLTDGGSSNVAVDDFPTSATVNWQWTPPKYRVLVTGVTSSNSGPYRRDGINRLVITTAAPHNLSPGQRFYVEFPVEGGRSVITHALNLAAGGTQVFNFDGTAYPLTATTFVFGGWFDPSSPALAPTDLTATGAFLYVQMAHPPMDWPFRLPGAIGADCDAVYAIPPMANDAAIHALGQAAGGVFPPGRLLYTEVGNEPWNPGLGYPIHYHAIAMGREIQVTDGTWPSDDGSIGAWWLMKRSGEAWAQFRAGFVAGGGDPAMLRNAINVAPQGGGYLTQALGYAAAHSLTVDVVMVSTYLSIYCLNAALPAARYDALRVDQTLDYCDMFMFHYDRSEYAANYQVTLEGIIAASAFPDVAMGAYEGGLRAINFSGTQSVTDKKTVSCLYHPRIKKPFQYQMRYSNDRGYLFNVKLGSDGTIANEGSQVIAYNWALNYDSRPGPGDGTDGLPDVRDELVNTDGTARVPDPRRLKSAVAALAVDEWNGTAADYFTAAPSSVTAGSGSHTLALAGYGTAWDGSTTFTVSGVSGTSKTAQSVTDGTHATVTISVGSTTGTLSVSDGTITAYVTVSAVSASFTVSPSSIAADSSNHTLTLTGTSTAWGGGTTFTVSGVTGVAKVSQNVTTTTAATVVVSTATTAGTATLSDGAATHNFTVTTPTPSSGRVLLVRRS